MPNIRWLLALITSVQRWLYLKTGGAIGASFFGIGMLLLTNVGRKTGHRRVTPLLYIEDGDHWVVVASNAGDRKPPAWWLNLEANPNARIQVRREHHDVVARRATAEETERLWPVLESSYRWFESYRAKAGREIPIVILERTASAG